MLVKTKVKDSIIEFLKQDYIINLNILGVLENVPEAEVYVDNEAGPKGVLVKKNEYMHYLYSKDDDFINYIAEEYLKTGFYGFSGLEISIAEKIMRKHVVSWESPVTVYYMPEGNLDKKPIKNKVMSIDSKDAEEVDKYYKYRSNDSLASIKQSIKNRPSSAVYVGDEMACWVLVHEDNSMGIMYTKEEYRRKGYAVDVTLDLAAKVVENGKIPFIQIVKGNDQSIGLAKKTGFVEHGEAKWFGVISGIPEELIKGNIESRMHHLRIFGEGLEEKIFGVNSKYYGMYLAMINFNNDFQKDQDFELINPINNNMMSIWCDICSSLYGLDKGQDERLRKNIFEELKKEKPSIIPFLGLKKGEPVSISILLEEQGDVYAVFCPQSTNSDRKVLEVTLNETLKAAGEHNGFLLFTQAAADRVGIFEEIGFKITNTY